MEVILLEKIANLGDLGEQVKVKPGFGRNYLLPQRKAVPANAANVAKFEAQRAELEKKAKERLQVAQQRAAELQRLNISINAMASDEGKLYGSVGANEIADAIEEAGQKVEKREILLPEGPIHELGEFDIALAVHSDVTATIKVTVEAAK